MDTETRAGNLTWRDRIVQEALTWKGTPFHHKGRIKGVGCDCGGFIYEVFNHALPNLSLPAFPNYYAEDWALHRDNEIYLAFLQPYVKEVNYMLPGCVVVFQVGRNFSHGTIVISPGKVIHAWGRTKHGKVKINHLPFFENRKYKIFDLREEWH